MTTTTTKSLQELAYRTGDGLEVTLFWQPADNGLMLCVCDQRRGAYFVVKPEARRALDAFYHPFSYISSSELLYEDERLAA